MASSSDTRLLVPALAPLYNSTAEFAYFLIRLAVGGAVLVHGVNKLMAGPAPVIASMAKNGFEPAVFFGYLIITMETVGAICVILGLFTRFFAAGLAIESAVLAFIVHWPNGFGANKNGYEMVLIWALVFFAIALRGGGKWSIDRKIGVEL